MSLPLFKQSSIKIVGTHVVIAVHLIFVVGPPNIVALHTPLKVVCQCKIVVNIAHINSITTVYLLRVRNTSKNILANNINEKQNDLLQVVNFKLVFPNTITVYCVFRQIG